MKTVGLFSQDTRIYFVNDKLVIMKHPHNGGVLLCKRQPGEPTKDDWTEIAKALLTTNMKAKGEAYIREDGLWCCSVERR